MSPLSCSGMVSESASVHAEGHNLRRSLSGLIHRPPSGNFSHGLLLLHNSKDQAPLQALRTPAVSLIFHCVTNHPLQRVFFFFCFFTFFVLTKRESFLKHLGAFLQCPAHLKATKAWVILFTGVTNRAPHFILTVAMQHYNQQHQYSVAFWCFSDSELKAIVTQVAEENATVLELLKEI